MSRKYSRSKIRLDRGDTLGGTVPLSLRDHVQPDVGFGERRFSRRRRGGSAWLSWTFTILLALALAGGLGLLLGALGEAAPAAEGEETAGLWSSIQAWLDAQLAALKELF
ncbi:MAG: hypothetical protein RIB45_11035 [Marivibrio sp.]|uniref:hypothetical protein n=1 Tax=Marivibrio sp. TaxID=2039719 RepID=UPI0032EB508B